jgi:hypothetical protein
MKSALSERLQEMDRAVEISSAVARQEQQAEPPQQQAAPEIPEPVQQWLRLHCLPRRLLWSMTAP